MAEWRVGRSVGRTLYLDGKLVGLVDTAELAAEIVETMNRAGALLEIGRERSRVMTSFVVADGAPVHACPETGSAVTPCCGRNPHELLGHRMAVDPTLITCAPDAERRSTPAITYTEFDRVQDQLSRVDPYDTTKGFTDGD